MTNALFIVIERMTPGEYKNGGTGLTIRHAFAPTPFGEILIASTSKGICSVVFVDDKETALCDLHRAFPNAAFRRESDSAQKNTLSIFARDWSKLPDIKLHLKGTPFQLKVWETLLKIPTGGLSTYGSVAARVGHPTACRAVGTAVGGNPVAFLIPCHRVIQSTGVFGNYRWGSARKAAMIGWEAVGTAGDSEDVS